MSEQVDALEKCSIQISVLPDKKSIDVAVIGQSVDLMTMIYSAMKAYPEIKALILTSAQFWEMKQKQKTDAN